MSEPLIFVENKIPFIKGRLEPHARVVYFKGSELSRQLIADADALLVRTRDVCDELLLGGTRVSLVATGTIGMDHIDREWCAAAGIKTANSPGCNAPGVAQYVFASLLALEPDLKGKRLGIIGCGNVGSIVAEWAEALGMTPIVCDPPRADAESCGRPPLKETYYRPDRFHSLDETLEIADIVTLHTPLTRTGDHATRHLISDRVVPLLKGKILVNAARGGVTDTSALIKATQDYGTRLIIDCWENEPVPDRRLLGLAEIASPHIAGYSKQGKERATRMIIEATGEHFGFTPDTTGLERAYVPLSQRPAGSFTPNAIRESFDPHFYTGLLKRNPERFEAFREELPYRDEVGIQRDNL